MSRWVIWVLGTLLLLLLGACRQAEPEPMAPLESTAPPPAATATPTTVPTPEPATPTPTLAPTVEPVWPSLDPLDPAPETWEELEAWLLAAWREGRNPAEVHDALVAAGWQMDEQELQVADLTGDGENEWVLLLHDIAVADDLFVPVFGTPGDLWVLNGDGLFYQHHADSDIPPYEAALMPELVGIADLTGDGVPELIVMDSDCGAHTCFGFVQVIGLVEGQMQNLVRGLTGDADWVEISFPDVWVEPVDGQDALHVHGGAIGSVGAGVMRTYTEVWAWDGDAIVWQATILDPTTYRHLVLYEGIDAMAAGDLDRAADLFEAAAMSPDLDTVAFMDDSVDETDAAIRQFAAFRLILVRLLQDDEVEAAAALAWLEGQGLGDPLTPAAPLTQAARRLVDEWAGPEGMVALCDALQIDLEAYDAPMGPLEYQGYGNPSLTAEHLCEFP